MDFKAHLINRDHPFAEHAFAVLGLSSRIDSRADIANRPKDIEDALKAGEDSTRSNLGLEFSISVSKAGSAKDILLSPAGRLVNELLAPEPQPLPWIGHPEDRPERFAPNVMLEEILPLLEETSRFDDVLFLARRLPVAEPSPPTDDTARKLPRRGRGAPISACRLLPSVGRR